MLLLFLQLCLPPSRAAEPGLSLRSLEAPLRAQGWTPSPQKGASLRAGDIVDPLSQKVLIPGADCFDPGAARRSSGLSYELQQSLSLAGRGLWGLIRAEASGGAQVELRVGQPEVEELAVSRLLPGASCLGSLQGLQAAGRSADSMVVVQATLTADVEWMRCLEGGASAAAPASSASAGLQRCERVEGSRSVIGLRLEPLRTALLLSGADLGPARAERPRKGSPCWLASPCPPYLAPAWRVAIGEAAGPGEADRSALDALLLPLWAALAPLAGPAEEQRKLSDELEARARVLQRYLSEGRHHSLAGLEMAPLLNWLRVQMPTPLQGAVDEGTVAQLQSLSRQIERERRVLYWGSLEAALLDRPLPDPQPLAQLRQQWSEGRAALRLRPLQGAASAPVGERLGGLGYRFDPAGALELRWSLELREQRQGGLVQVAHVGQLELRSGQRLISTRPVSVAAASAERGRALQGSLQLLEEELVQLCSQSIEEALR